MPTIVDYGTLKQAILDFTHRATLATYVDYFIQDGEDRIYRKILELNEGMGIQWMESALSLSIDANTGKAAVPADYLSLKAAQVQGDGGQWDLEQKSAQWIYQNFPIRQADSPPSYIAREGTNFIFGPFPDSSYGVVGTYYQRAAALSATNTTTWMTANIPMTLLAACMTAASKFLKDLPAVQAWESEMIDRLQAVIHADKAADLGSSPLVISPAGPRTSLY